MKFLAAIFLITLLKAATARTVATNTETEKDRELRGGGCFTGKVTELNVNRVFVPKNYQDGRKLTESEPESESFNPGDLFAWSENPLCRGSRKNCDKNPKSLVGSSQGYCTGLPNSIFECHIDLFFNDGEDMILLRGPGAAKLSGASTNVAVIGGTGCYGNARGSVSITFDVSDFSYHYDLSKVTNTD
eukprot:CAMPEP_0185728832 /NCGR_PEP_ID=MMETSP1171-20130828/4237_1 /TAXON_ID=374046 /ORGANISM="Helicotheca tamensis, Strain CCMP826" /LENGTH=187 /DNA_ID=CAMNT_0028397579 /DNA_START=49 /DNA_END=612 /DNA_ORIENTATION=+